MNIKNSVFFGLLGIMLGLMILLSGWAFMSSPWGIELRQGYLVSSELKDGCTWIMYPDDGPTRNITNVGPTSRSRTAFQLRITDIMQPKPFLNPTISESDDSPFWQWDTRFTVINGKVWVFEAIGMRSKPGYLVCP